MSKSALRLNSPRNASNNASTASEGIFAFVRQISWINFRKSLKGLSATTPASVKSRAACMSEVAAPIEKPQSPIRVKP